MKSSSLRAMVLVVAGAGLFAPAAVARPAFTQVSGSPFFTGIDSLPASVAFSPSGKLLASANSASKSLSVFRASQGRHRLTASRQSLRRISRLRR